MTCSTCGNEVLLSNMGTSPRQCKQCHNEYMKTYRSQHRATTNELARQGMAKLRGTDIVDIEERRYYRNRGYLK